MLEIWRRQILLFIIMPDGFSWGNYFRLQQQWGGGVIPLGRHEGEQGGSGLSVARPTRGLNAVVMTTRTPSSWQPERHRHDNWCFWKKSAQMLNFVSTWPHIRNNVTHKYTESTVMWIVRFRVTRRRTKLWSNLCYFNNICGSV